MKKITLLLLLLLGVNLLASCASQTMQMTIGKALIATHDVGKSAGEALNALCVQKIIPPDPCINTIKPAYDKFRLAWPVVDDALLVYLDADPDDTAAMTAFQIAQKLFGDSYADLMALSIQFGIFKQEVK